MKKIVFNVQSVIPQLAQVASVVNVKNPIQILGSILFETFDNGRMLLLTASDGEVSLSMKAPLIEGDVDVKFCVEAKQFLTTLRGLANKNVELRFEEGEKTCTGVYNNGKFTLPFDNAAEYPKLPNVENDITTTNIEANRLFNAVAATEYAAANDELRPTMNGVHFDFFNDKLVSVASDSHVLAKYTDKTIKSSGEQNGFTMTSKVAHLLTNVLQKEDCDVKVVFNDKAISVNNAQFRLISRLIEGRYPNYDSVIPQTHSIESIVSSETIISALKRVLPMGSQTNELVVLDFDNNKLTISAENIDFSTSASETIDCEYNNNKFRIGFNGSSLAKTITNMGVADVKVRFLMSEPNRAVIIQPISSVDDIELISLIMPMTIND